MLFHDLLHGAYIPGEKAPIVSSAEKRAQKPPWDHSTRSYRQALAERCDQQRTEFQKVCSELGAWASKTRNSDFNILKKSKNKT